MEWVVTTASTIEGARELALDELGVDASEAEFEVLQEPSKGFVGIGAKQARVQARIVPTVPRAKQDGRSRRRRTPRQSDRGGQRQSKQTQKSEGGTNGRKTSQKKKPVDKNKSGSNNDSSTRKNGNTKPKPAQAGKSGQSNPKEARRSKDQSQVNKEAPVEDPMTLEEQGEVAAAFLTGLRDQMGLTGDVVKRDIDEDNLEVAIDGDGLGLLVGPKGQTLHALQEVTKTVLQRKAVNGAKGRIRVDVGGYREHRREALIAFTTQAAEDVLDSGSECSLEPMIASERKIVHDTVNDIDGVATISEGTDPRRRVVIVSS